MTLSTLLTGLQEAVRPLSVIGGTLLLGLLLSLLLVGIIRRVVARRNATIADEVRHRLQLPSLIFTPAVLLSILLPLARLPDRVRRPVRDALEVALIISTVWLIIRAFRLVESAVDARYPVDVEDNLKARKVHTQIRYLRQIASFLVGLD